MLRTMLLCLGASLLWLRERLLAVCVAWRLRVMLMLLRRRCRRLTSVMRVAVVAVVVIIVIIVVSVAVTAVVVRLLAAAISAVQGIVLIIVQVVGLSVVLIRAGIVRQRKGQPAVQSASEIALRRHETGRLFLVQLAEIVLLRGFHFRVLPGSYPAGGQALC